jgi:hypothetical protein
MLAGTDGHEETAKDLDRLAELAVREVVAAWAMRRIVAKPSPKSPLGRLLRGECSFVDISAVGTPSLLRSWLLTVEIAGRSTRAELGFDGLLLVADLVASGKRYVTIAAERGWRRSEVAKNYQAAVWSLALQFAQRGVTRELAAEEGAA